MSHFRGKSVISLDTSNFYSLPTQVPAGVIDAKHEILHQPKTSLLHKYPNLISFDQIPFGGHFFAFEEPKYLANHFFNFVTEAEKQSFIPNNAKKSEL